jgi:hypothetical protein
MTAYNLRDRAPSHRNHHTLTDAGAIPHARLVSADGSIRLDAPVKLLPARRGEELARPKVARDRIGYVYALPAGGEWEG